MYKASEKLADPMLRQRIADRGRRFFRNVVYVRNYAASHPTRPDIFSFLLFSGRVQSLRQNTSIVYY